MQKLPLRFCILLSAPFSTIHPLWYQLNIQPHAAFIPQWSDNHCQELSTWLSSFVAVFAALNSSFVPPWNTNWWGQQAHVCSGHARQDQTRRGMFTGKSGTKVRQLDQISHSNRGCLAQDSSLACIMMRLLFILQYSLLIRSLSSCLVHPITSKPVYSNRPNRYRWILWGSQLLTRLWLSFKILLRWMDWNVPLPGVY